MANDLWQIWYRVDGLIPSHVKLKRKVWLRPGEIFLEKKGERLDVHILHEGEYTSSEDKILPYLKFSSFLSNNSVHIEGGSGCSIASRQDFGKTTERPLHVEIRVSVPEIAADDIAKQAPRFLRQIRDLHDRYIDVVKENRFLSIALDFLYEANNKSVSSDEGFISAVICLEALFNEGSSDISYKIAHRAAFLLGLAKKDSKEVFQNLKAIYSDRSKLIHGVGLDGNYNPRRYEVIRYARVSTIIFLILLKNTKRQKVKKGNRKQELLTEIDHAMLDTSRRDALQKEIERGMQQFELTVPRTFQGTGEMGDYRLTAW